MKNQRHIILESIERPNVPLLVFLLFICVIMMGVALSRIDAIKKEIHSIHNTVKQDYD